MFSPAEYLGDDGPLSSLINGFAPRAQQQEMAEAVMHTLTDNGMLIAEAGTGTGKTFAYLLPALMFGGKAIISTGTKNLQDQLFHRDLPVVRRALNMPVTAALLKGRANYVCKHRLEMYDSARSKGDTAVWARDIKSWATQTQSGDIAEVPDIPEDASIWSHVTSTAENCIGQECESYSACFLVKARRNAQEADVLVINHHLLLADMALKEDGFGEVLPGTNAFIIDEAHQLPDIATNFFGTAISSRQLLELSRDAVKESIKEARDMKSIRSAGEALEKAVRDMRLAFERKPQRGAWQAIFKKPKLQKAINKVNECLGQLEDLLEFAAERGKGLEACFKRATALRQHFDAMSGKPSEDEIHWFETYTSSFTLYQTPMNISETFRSYMEQYNAAWVFTSATLAVNTNFEHFTDRLGLQDANTSCWESPFDFQQQSLLYLPQDLPSNPNDFGYTEAVVKAALPVIRASGGRSFMLFTSHAALRKAADLLKDVFEYPLLIQGDAPRAELLDEFRAKGNAILLGTSSFWEGVDVRGDALACVIIDKLPFAPPDDPVLQARMDAMRNQGLNPFMTHQLPSAVITLKQGVGRLIRDQHDKGVLMLCDPRLTEKSYGKIFLRSLPQMPQTRSLEQVEQFFAHHWSEDEAEVREPHPAEAELL